MAVNKISIRPISHVKQLFVRKGRRPHKVPCGLFRGLTLLLDLQTQTQLYLGLWERETHKYIKEAARTCEWVVDVGAGKGELCLYFLKSSKAARIWAFEPQTAETDIFWRNLALNGEQDTARITISNKFVGTKMDSNHIQLDSLQVETNNLGFLKIDVDGKEVDVLKSGELLLSHNQVCVLVETHSRQLEEECVDLLTLWGYTVLIVKNAWWRFIIPEQRPCPHNRWLWARRA